MITTLAMLAAAAVPSPELQQAIQKYFDTTVTNGRSTEYRWPATVESPTQAIAKKENARLYCGWVNIKNGAGVFGGFKPFAIFFDGVKVGDGTIAERPSGLIAVKAICEAGGYNVTTPPTQ